MSNFEIEWGKLFLLLVAIVCATVLLLAHAVEQATGVGIITGALGYVFGNGRLAAKRKSPEPLIKRPDLASDESK